MSKTRNARRMRRSAAPATLALTLALTLTATAAAETPGATGAQAAAFTFAIPAKPLGQALDDFGRVTGVSVVYADKSAAALPAPALSGRMSADTALSRLLAGSGVAHRFVNPATVTLEPPPVVGGGAMQLGPVVVSAAGHETSLRDAPASISIITGAEFEKQPVRDLTQVLSKVEGVTLRRAGNLHNIQIRGFDSNYVLSMVDGKRVDTTTSVFRGNDYDTGWVNGDAIERVEVVRGPMSSLYGSDAVGGVVNVITKKPGDKWTGSVNGGYTFQENRESGDSWKTGFYAAGPIVKDLLGAKIYGAHDRRLGDEDVNPKTGAGGVRQLGVNDSRNANINGELIWTPDAQTDVTADFGFSERSHADSQTILRQSGGLAYKGGFDFGAIEAKVYGDKIRNLDGNIAGQKNPNSSTSLAADAKAVVPVNLWGQTLSFGGDVRRNTLKDPSTIVGLPGTASYRATDEEKISQYSLFAEDEIVVTDDLRLTFGNRYDHHENFGGHNSPRAYAVYHLTDEITFKTGWSQAFKAPTLLQTSPNWGSVSCGSATAGCYIIGSSDLKPETSISKEIGVSGDFGKIGGGVTLFRNDLKDMVDITSRTANRTLARSYSNFVGYLPDGRPIFKYQNIAKARTQGVEATFRFEPAENVKVRLNYTYLDAVNRSGTIELPLVYRSKHTGNAAVDWEIDERWNAFFNASYIGSQYVSVPSNGVNMLKQDGFVTFDIGAGYKLTDDFTITAGVLNIADKEVKRTNTSEFNEDGRRYFVSATSRF